MRVLVVDDDRPILETVDEILRSEGFEVRATTDPRRAVRSARDFHPDVALIDMMMPGLDGVELARRLRQEPGLRDVPIILMSAHPDGSLFARDAHAAFLPKPFSLRRLLAMLHGEGQAEADDGHAPSPS